MEERILNDETFHLEPITIYTSVVSNWLMLNTSLFDRLRGHILIIAEEKPGHLEKLALTSKL